MEVSWQLHALAALPPGKEPLHRNIRKKADNQNKQVGSLNSFSKYLPCEAMHFLERSTHFSKTCCRPFAASFRRTVEEVVLSPRTFQTALAVAPPL
jgi:hypothetical protein